MMEYLHHSSHPATKSELELFNIPPTQTAIETYYEVQFRPTSTLDSTRNYDFIIPASDDFTDLSSTIIYLNGNVLNSDLSKLTETSITPVKNFGNALFEQVDFYLGNVSITPANNLYHYQSFLEDLIFRQPNPIDFACLNATENERSEFIAKSRTFDLYFRLHNCLCQQNNLLISGVPITIRLSRSKDDFPLVGNTSCVVEISEIYM